MRIFKITLSILVLLVIGLIALQIYLVKSGHSIFDRDVKFSPVETPQAASNAVPRSDETEPDQMPDPKKPPVKSLISSSQETDFVWTSRTPAAKRVKQVFPDTSWMIPDPVLKAGDIITLALFDDAVFEARIRNVTVYPNGAVGMTAHLIGEQQGTVYLSYSDQQMRASVEIPGGDDYAVRYLSDAQSHYAIEVDWANSVILEGAEPMLADTVSRKAESVLPEILPDAVAASDAPTGNTIIDVMIVYTPAAASWAGGQNGISTVVAEAMQRANEAHQNSDTQITLRLVHSTQVNYTETNASADLNKLTYSGGSYSEMDEVHDWRDEYGADFVCLLEDDPYYAEAGGVIGGLGWLMDSEFGEPDYAFCIARVQQSAGTYTVVHEWGHNMGCSHSKTQVDYPWDANDFRSYSAGWQWADTKPYSEDGYCTIMTYERFSSGLTYKRVAYFSNPDINYIGNSTNATGHVSDGDNARTIREMKTVFEDYRASIIVVSEFPSSNSFENAYTPWRNYGGEITWDRDSGGTASPETGPSSGAEGEYYIYTEASNYNSWDEALLQAVFDFSSLDNPEIRFSYHMYGEDMGALILQASTNAGVSWAMLWQESGNKGDVWLSTNISLSAYGGSANVQLRFRGIIGNGSKSDMALDAVVVDEASAPPDDVDNDGLPNWWEERYFGGPTNANPTNTAANGLNTVMETYIAGINPTNPASFFAASMTNQNGFVVHWNSLSGRVYSVLGSTNLQNSFQPLETNILWPRASWTDTVEHSENFYQVDVKLE